MKKITSLPIAIALLSLAVAFPVLSADGQLSTVDDALQAPGADSNGLLDANLKTGRLVPSDDGQLTFVEEDPTAPPPAPPALLGRDASALALRPSNASGSFCPTDLTSLFGQNNGFRGNSFDLEATSCLEIVGWDFNFTNNAGVMGDVSIYWRDGTASGFENNGGAGWNLLGTVTVTTAGNNQPTPVPLGGLVMQPGEVKGIYYYVNDYPNPRTGYTNGSGVFSNGDLTLTTLRGIGTTSPFGAGGLFNNRQVNVTVHYDTASAGCGASGVELCHVPPGNPENAHEINVGPAAVGAHLAHGDACGACPAGN